MPLILSLDAEHTPLALAGGKGINLTRSDGQAFCEGVTAPEARDDAAIYGDPVSPGAIEGVVRVVLDPRAAQLMP